MSGFHTHMLIGAVGGFAAFKITERFLPSALVIPVTFSNTTYLVPPTVIGIGAVLISAYLALWPDIDEPGSHISRRARQYMWLFGAIVGLILGLASAQSIILLIGFSVIGAAVGSLGGGLILRAIRFLSGGHRHLTHSLLVTAVLMVLAGVLYFMRLQPFVLPLLAIAWGQILHLVGDVVTPGGVPLFYPLYSRNLHLLPYEISRFGEPLIAGTAILVGIAFCFW